MALTSTPDLTLAVDLDGSLLCGDLSLISVLELVRQRPLFLLLLPFWLLGGRAAFKRNVAQRVVLDPAAFGYHAEVLEFVRQQRARGRKTVLATGSDLLLANPVAEYLACFDEVLASDGAFNNTGRRKEQALVRHSGFKGYDYIGNSKVDIPVWQSAAHVLVVSDKPRFCAHLAQQFEVTRVFN